MSGASIDIMDLHADLVPGAKIGKILMSYVCESDLTRREKRRVKRGVSD